MEAPSLCPYLAGQCCFAACGLVAEADGAFRLFMLCVSLMATSAVRDLINGVAGSVRSQLGFVQTMKDRIDEEKRRFLGVCDIKAHVLS